MPPVFYSYEVQPEPCGGIPDFMIEADGQLIHSKFHWTNIRMADWLGVPTPSAWHVEAAGDASWGAAEFSPDDDGDNLLFWKVEAGKVILRVQNRVVVLDVSHINQPSSPSTPEIGGEA